MSKRGRRALGAGEVGPAREQCGHFRRTLADVDEWWHTFEVNETLYVHAAARSRAHGRARRLSASSMLHPARRVPADARKGPNATAYPASKAAVNRFSEAARSLARAAERVRVLDLAGARERTAMTARFGEDAPWTPPERALRSAHALATGEFDKLAVLESPRRARPAGGSCASGDTYAILADDLNVVRLKR